MAERTSAGYLCRAKTTTGRVKVELPAVPSVTLLFIDIISGTASITVELRDGRSTGFIPVKTITSDAVVKLALPASVIACNITAVTGSVTITYRSVVVDSIPNLAIEVFTGGVIEPAIVTTTGTVTSTIADVQKRLYGPAQPGATSTTLYTVPAAKKTTLEYIHAINTTGAAQTVTIAIGASITAALSILSAYSIPATGIFTLPCEISLVAAETVLGLQSSATAITVTLNGTETSV